MYVIEEICTLLRVLLILFHHLSIANFREGAGSQERKECSKYGEYDKCLKCSTQNKGRFSIENGRKEVEKGYSL